MAENSATATMRKNLKLLMPGIDMQRIEDKLTSGIPDLNACWSGVEFWMEGKFIKDLPVRASSIVRFGPKDDERLVYQARWLEKRQLAGGQTFLWCRVRDGRWFLWVGPNFDFLYNGMSKESLLKCLSFASAKDLVAHVKGLLLECRCSSL